MKLIDAEDIGKVIEEFKFNIKISDADMFTKSDVGYILDQVEGALVSKGISATINRRIDTIKPTSWRPDINYSE
jgi:hypothetical protein